MGKGFRLWHKWLCFSLHPWSLFVVGEQFLKFAVTLWHVQGRDELRLESVLQAATCGAENARESEDYFGRVFDGNAGSGSWPS